ncbi:cupin [Comamonas piscis]|uniref:Cupin n=1 Tax=Comamonas piscis TaxID=1562974 RepID=A0A7G5EHJ7_9BURK|nr:cupin domain-containing protein [Comamonas piscis]QMV73472.1 cupin [Comamonas piscis]WSO31886.1 cupin domain-containing protein [Comamonas piscis]
MSLFDLHAIANGLPAAWNSTVLGSVGSANIKLLRMDQMPYGEEVHDYDEALLVVSGQMMLEIAGQALCVEASQMYIAEAGVPHAVLAGSHGCLVIVDL